MALLCIVIFVAAVAGITMGAFHTHHDRSMFVGILCVVFNVVMYASPLTVMVIESPPLVPVCVWIFLGNLVYHHPPFFCSDESSGRGASSICHSSCL